MKAQTVEAINTMNDTPSARKPFNMLGIVSRERAEASAKRAGTNAKTPNTAPTETGMTALQPAPIITKPSRF